MVSIRITHLQKFASSVLLTLLLPLCASAQVSISVDATKAVRTVDERHFGTNTNMWDRQSGSAQTVELVKAAGLRTIRIPGGSLSDYYDWSTNTGYTALGVFNNWTWFAGMDQFMNLVQGTNSHAYVIVNYGSGTPEQAAAWVAYANADANLLGTAADITLGVDSLGVDWKTAGYWSKLRASAPLPVDDKKNFLRQQRTAPYALKYWAIGNEIFGSWEVDYQVVAHDPYTYANRSKAYMAKMRAVDPTIKIGVVVENTEDAYANNTSHPATNPRTGVTHNGWTPVLLATLKSNGAIPDFLDYHYYPQNPNRESDANLLQVSQNWATYATNLRNMLNDYLGSDLAAGIEIVITENNSVSSDGGKQMTNLVNALYYADRLASVLQTEFNAFIWWALRNGPTVVNGAFGGNMNPALYGWRPYGEAGVLSMPTTVAGGATDYYTPFPTYYSMKLMSLFARGGDTVVKVTSGNTLLSAYSVKEADGTLNLLVINKSPTADQTGNIALTGYTPKANATVYSYGIPQDEAARTGSGSQDVATSSLSNGAISFSYVFPKYSLTVISMTPMTPDIVLQPAQALTLAGSTAVFAVGAEGQGPITYQWQRLANGLSTWTNLFEGGSYTGTQSAKLSVLVANGMSGDQFRCAVSNNQGASYSRSVPLTVSTKAGAQFFALATRSVVGSGTDVLISGIVITGSVPKKVVIRALGPALVDRNITNFMPDPVLRLATPTGQTISTNDNWPSTDPSYRAAFRQAYLGDLPDGSKDAAIVATLAPGVYTPIVTDKNGVSGVALVEFYDLDSTTGSLSAISARAMVGTGADVLIPGLVIQGTSSKKLLIRVAGPELLTRDIPEALLDPQFEIVDSTGASIYANDNWDNTDATLIATTNAVYAPQFKTGSKDAAIVVSLAPGNYSIVIRGVNNTKGIALVELFDVP